jgi:uncharacterized protein (DUF433 family)
MNAISLTLSEAGYVVGQSTTSINRAIDRGVIKAKLHRRGKSRLREIGPAELRFLAISGEVEKDLTPAARKKVYEAIRRLPADEHLFVIGVMEFKLDEIDRRIGDRLRHLEEVKAMVDLRAGDEPVIRGTDIPAYVVAALASGQTTAELIEDFPGLTATQIAAATEYAKIYPKPGRPLPTRSFKRTLSDMASSGVWDVENSDEPVTPHRMP